MIRACVVAPAALGAGLLLVAGGCGSQTAEGGGDRTGQDRGVRACTKIGCVSGTTVHLRGLRPEASEASRVRICAGGRCRTVALPAARATLGPASVRGRDRVRVRIVVMNRRGDAIARDSLRVRVRRRRPNGPGCPPVCRQADVRLDPDTLRLRPA